MQCVCWLSRIWDRPNRFNRMSCDSQRHWKTALLNWDNVGRNIPTGRRQVALRRMARYLDQTVDTPFTWNHRVRQMACSMMLG